MNAHRKSLKLLFPAAMTLTRAVGLVGLVATCVTVVRNGARFWPIAFTPKSNTTREESRVRLHSLMDRGTRFREMGHYQEAEPPLREALALAEEAFGSQSFETAAVLNQLGVLGKYNGQFDEAEAAYKRALRIMEQTGGLENELGATLFHNLGGLEHARGRFAAGEPYARPAVGIRQRLRGPEIGREARR